MTPEGTTSHGNENPVPLPENAQVYRDKIYQRGFLSHGGTHYKLSILVGSAIIIH